MTKKSTILNPSWFRAQNKRSVRIRHHLREEFNYSQNWAVTLINKYVYDFYIIYPRSLFVSLYTIAIFVEFL